jgi:hypothetical protein
MLAMVDEQRLQRLAEECLQLSERTEDARTDSQLLGLSNRVLQLATPTLPTWQERIPRTRWLPPPRNARSVMRNAVAAAKSYFVRPHS